MIQWGILGIGNIAKRFIKSLEMFMGALVRSTHFCAMIRITFR